MNFVYWIWLQQALGYANPHFKNIIERLGSAEQIYKLTPLQLSNLGITSKRVIEKLCNKQTVQAENIISECGKSQIKIIPYGSENYPLNLKEISAPPAVIYAKGDTKLLKDGVGICIVGPRKVSEYGKKAAYSLAARLALCGFTVVSGGAVGCDTAAHKGALNASGKTICVLGAGINYGYPNENALLRREIANAGLLISEYPPNYPASKYTFPTRNRLMSGIALGTVVIEAAEKSGTLITANIAAEQGRDVFVIPGNPTQPQYKGSNKLLRDGAKPVLELNDIVSEYTGLYSHKINPERAYSKKISMPSEKNTSKTPVLQKNIGVTKKIIKENLSNNAKIVYNQLDKPIFYIDELEFTGLSDSEVLAAFTELEIFEYIKALPGGKYGLISRTT